MKSMRYKKLLSVLTPLIVVTGIFILGANAHALVEEWALSVVSGLLGVIISALGLVLMLVIQGLVAIASYQDFIGSQAVMLGWHIVRDVCNMFFVVILMIIAFGTILHLENYNYKKWLPKLILMAVLINFSKTICGLLIDVSQVVMLTFVNAFKDIGGGNLTQMLGISDIVTMAKNSKDVGFWTVVGAYVLGMIYLIVAIVVIVTMLMMLAMRLVMIWIYVVLSPLAYLLSAFPGGQKYASQWWEEFTKSLIVGPVLAFFLWLSLASLSGSTNVVSYAGTNDVNSQLGINGQSMAASSASTPNALIKFVIGIGMLIGGLKIASSVGGTLGGMAGKGMSAVQKSGKIGLGAVGAVTGYRYASGVAKSYNAQRKAKREEGYKVGAERLAGAVGNVKKTVVATPVNALRNNILGKHGVKAQKAAKEAKELREQTEMDDFNFKRKEEVGNWKYDDKSKKWVHNKTKRTMENDDMEKLVERKRRGFNNLADKKENEAKEERGKQAKVDKLVKRGQIASTIIATVATGGAFGLAAGVATGAAAIGGNKLYKYSKNAGEEDLNMASNWRLRQVSEGKDKLKTSSNDDVLASMDDASKSAFARAAAAMEAIERGLVSLNDAKNRKEEIKDSLGGKNSSGGWNDKKLGSYVENIIEKKYPGASRAFEDLDNPDLTSSDPEKKKEAERKKGLAEKTISDRFAQGTYSLDLDTGTLEKSIKYLASTLRNGEFTRQFKSLKDQTKKDAIVKALKKEDSQSAKEKLAGIKDLKFAFGDDQNGKEKYLAGLSMEDLRDVFNKGTADQQNAIRDAVTKSTKLTKIDIFVNAKNALEGTAPAVVDLKKKLGI